MKTKLVKSVVFNADKNVRDLPMPNRYYQLHYSYDFSDDFYVASFTHKISAFIKMYKLLRGGDVDIAFIVKIDNQ